MFFSFESLSIAVMQFECAERITVIVFYYFCQIELDQN